MAIGEAFDEVLVAAQAGAGWAFSRLYEDLAGVVTGYLRMRGARDPDDVTSEAFLQVFRNIGSFEGGEQQFRSWVFTIAHRRLLDERRYWSRRPLTTDLVADVDLPVEDEMEDRVIGWLQSERLGAMLDELSEGQREVVLLRIVAGLTIEETAEVIGKRPGAVKQLQRRGLLKLKEEISREGVTL